MPASMTPLHMERAADNWVRDSNFKCLLALHTYNRQGAAHLCESCECFDMYILFRMTVWAFSRYLDVILSGRDNLLDRFRFVTQRLQFRSHTFCVAAKELRSEERRVGK